MSSSPTAIDEYLNYQTEAEKKYGENTIVFYENGTFYEIYGVDNASEKVGQPKRISELLNIAITRKNKKILENSRKNPLMVGVPTAHSEKYIKVLIQSGMTIVFVEQITKPPNPERALTRVISPSTYLSDDTKNDNNYVLAIYLEVVKNRDGRQNLGCGLCAIDITVGDVKYYEYNNTDFKIVYEEIFRFMESLAPKEIIFNLENCCIPFKEIQDNLEIYRYPYYIRELAKDYSKLGYQNSLLKKTFEIESPITAIEYLNLESQLLSIMAIMLAIDFIQEHDERILRHLHAPKEWEERKHLILNNNTLYQLNIVRDGISTGNIRSLFDIMNQTKTIIGKRSLKNWLMNPIVNAVILEKKYDILERIIGGKLWDRYDASLEFVIDLERFFRKMSIGYLMPHEMSGFEPTLDCIKRMIEMAEEDFAEEDNNWCDVFRIRETARTGFLEFYENYYRTFDVQLMGTFCLNDINQSFFNEGMIPELDEIQKLIGEQRKYFEKEAEKLSLLVDGKSTDAVKFDHNERDGYFLRTTSKRGEILAKKVGGGYSTRLTGANVCRVSSEKLETANLILQDAEFDIQTKVKDYFIKWCESQYMQYHESLCEIIRFISTVDMSMCLGKISLANNYRRPIIGDSESSDSGSFVQFEGLRHPIIEKINQEILYVPNDITIQREGILLYGLNGGGKSSLLKAVGLAVVMAQMGCFVPAERMVYYPFKTLYTRILGNDNIFRGLSSFALEMTELRSILRDSNKNSLILGDEICRGTEIHSALSIVSSAVSILCKRRTNFLFATHLHKLHEIDIICEAKNLRHFYIDLQFSEGRIVFGRKIFEGIGEKLYGIEVAEYIIDNEEFQRLATKTRRQLLDESHGGGGGGDGGPKSSSYNSATYVDECAICGKKQGQLDVHHIHSQKYADCNDTIEYFNKNHGGNLVVLCVVHHNQVHKGEITVHGWIETSHGKKLSWEKTSGKKVHIQGKSSRGGDEAPITGDLRANIMARAHLLKNISMKIFKAKMEKDYGVQLTTKQIKDLIVNDSSS